MTAACWVVQHLLGQDCPHSSKTRVSRPGVIRHRVLLSVAVSSAGLESGQGLWLWCERDYSRVEEALG